MDSGTYIALPLLTAIATVLVNRLDQWVRKELPPPTEAPPSLAGHAGLRAVLLGGGDDGGAYAFPSRDLWIRPS